MSSLIYFETNWIIGAVMGQDPHADDLLDTSKLDIHLVVPAVCLMEVISAFDWKRIERNRLKDHLETQLRQITRSRDVADAQQLAAELIQAKLTNDKLLNELFKRLDDYLLRVVNRAELIPVSARIVQESLQLVRATELERNDALILASILAHSSSKTVSRKAFLTGNYKDFDKEGVRVLLAEPALNSLELLKGFWVGLLARGLNRLDRSLKKSFLAAS